MSERTEVATRMAEAADLWLADLDDDQRAVAQWAFPADDERRLWFYTPTDHGGLHGRRDAPGPAAGGDAAAAQWSVARRRTSRRRR